MTHTIALREIRPLTHDTHHLIFDKPEGYRFAAGQSCHMALNREGWRDQRRPFSFVSQPEDDRLEFIVKTYPRDGVTAQIPSLRPGETVTIDAASGAITDRGPGVFIAGGAGITPFVPILRRRARDDDRLSECSLVYSNKTERDIILREEWEGMRGLGTVFTVTEQQDTELPRRRLDEQFLCEVLKGFREIFYICGPRGMTRNVMDVLKRYGVPDDKIIQDQF